MQYVTKNILNHETRKICPMTKQKLSLEFRELLIFQNIY